MSYPVSVLQGRPTALVLFAAAFGGANDAVYIRQAGLEADCVDTDAEALGRMISQYPASWRYTCMDAFDFGASARRAGFKWDVVSLDPFTNLFGRVAEHVSLWCSLAKAAVVMGSPGAEDLSLPRGWKISEVMRRSPIACWTVLCSD